MNKLFAVVIAVIAIGGMSQVRATPLGPSGPDGFGYSGNDLAFNLRDIAQSGTFVSLGDDQQSSAIALGFSFSFYGSVFNSVHISSNGFLDFDGGSSGCCTGRALPLPGDGLNGGIIAGFWEDLNNPQGNIRYQTLGPAGSREFVVGFYDVDHFLGTTPVTFEMILHEGSNDIEFQYLSAAADGVNAHSIGIERADETDGLQVFLGASSPPLPLISQGYCISSGATACTVPEPVTLVLLGFGLAGLGLARKRTRR